MFVKSAAILALAGAFTAVSASPTPDTIQLPDGDCAPHGIHLLVGEWTKVESRFKNENDYWWGPGQDESMSFPRFVFDFDAVKTPPYTREVFFLTTYKPNGQLWGDAQMDLSKLLIDQVMSCTIDAPTGMADKERCHEVVVQYQEPYISGGYADISATCGPITG